MPTLRGESLSFTTIIIVQVHLSTKNTHPDLYTLTHTCLPAHPLHYPLSCIYMSLEVLCRALALPSMYIHDMSLYKIGRKNQDSIGNSNHCNKNYTIAYGNKFSHHLMRDNYGKICGTVWVDCHL